MGILYQTSGIKMLETPKSLTVDRSLNNTGFFPNSASILDPTSRNTPTVLNNASVNNVLQYRQQVGESSTVYADNFSPSSNQIYLGPRPDPNRVYTNLYNTSTDWAGPIIIKEINLTDTACYGIKLDFSLVVIADNNIITQSVAPPEPMLFKYSSNNKLNTPVHTNTGTLNISFLGADINYFSTQTNFLNIINTVAPRGQNTNWSSLSSNINNGPWQLNARTIAAPGPDTGYLSVTETHNQYPNPTLSGVGTFLYEVNNNYQFGYETVYDPITTNGANGYRFRIWFAMGTNLVPTSGPYSVFLAPQGAVLLPTYLTFTTTIFRMNTKYIS